jgi:hypothetical protein
MIGAIRGAARNTERVSSAEEKIGGWQLLECHCKTPLLVCRGLNWDSSISHDRDGRGSEIVNLKSIRVES